MRLILLTLFVHPGCLGDYRKLPNLVVMVTGIISIVQVVITIINIIKINIMVTKIINTRSHHHDMKCPQVIFQLLFIQDVSRRRIHTADQVQHQDQSYYHHYHQYIRHWPKNIDRSKYLKISKDRTKPGRQIVTFLLICNLAIWVRTQQCFIVLKISNNSFRTIYFKLYHSRLQVIYTFEVQKVEESPVQVRS